MCGIVSLFNGETMYSRDVQLAFSQLLAANTVRGVHSTGLMYGGLFESEVYKKAVPGYDFVELPVVDRILTSYEDNKFLIGHNRAATRGTVTARNAHPFQHGHITGVHNGTLTTYKALVTGKDPYYPVDSEYIFAGMEQSSVANIIPQINGAFNLLWYDSSTDTVHMIRNEERPYYFAKITNKSLLFGASEMAMLQWILNRNGLQIEDVIIPDVMTEYVFDMSGDIFAPTEIKHEEYVTPPHVGPINRTPGIGYGAKGYDAGAGNRVERIPRSIEFFAEEWTSYGTSVPDTGKWECKTPANERVVVYQCTEDDLDAGVWYTGMTRTVRNEHSTYSVDISTVKTWVGDGPSGAVAGEMYRCVSCKSYFPEEELMFCDAAPLCQDCIDHYEIKLDGEKETYICH